MIILLNFKTQIFIFVFPTFSHFCNGAIRFDLYLGIQGFTTTLQINFPHSFIVKQYMYQTSQIYVEQLGKGANIEIY